MTPEEERLAYEAYYPEAYAFTKEFEGGYVDHPDDPGGCTNKGITIGTFRKWRDDPSLTCADLYMLSDDEAASIYYENYWKPVWGNKLPVGLNTQVWDFGVNAGPARAVKLLQTIVGATPDGIMGVRTLTAAVRSFERDKETLLNRYATARLSYYQSLPTWGTFGRGWERRNEECLALSLELAYAPARDMPPSPPPPPSTNLEAIVADLQARVTELERWRTS